MNLSEQSVKRTKLPVFYSCSRCPAYCCSYARIQVTDEDIARLAEHYGTTPKKARKRFTKKDSMGAAWRLKQKNLKALEAEGKQ